MPSSQSAGFTSCKQDEVTPLASREGVGWLGEAGSELLGGKRHSRRGWGLTPTPGPRRSSVLVAGVAAGPAIKADSAALSSRPCLNASQEQFSH